MSNCKTVRLGDVFEFNPKESIAKGAVAKKVAMDCLTPYCREISGFEFAEFSGGTKFRNGDTIMARITPCLENGKTAMVSILDDDEIGIGSTEYIVFREKEGISNKYFIYYFATNPAFRDIAIKSMVGSSGRQRVQQNVLENLEISLPPLAEQERIAGILGALDDKIECNNRINRNLEEQAAALFRRWFVDFEFPDADGNPYRSASGTMQDSPLGPIPTGWQVGTFRDIISSTIGGDWGKESAEANYSQKVYCIRGADITDVSKGEKGKMPFRYILPKNHIAKKLEVNDLVIEISGGSPTQSTGRIAIISDSLLKRYDEDMICTNFCRAIKPKTEYAHFIYSLWRYMYDQNIMFSYENGTTGIKNLNINGLVDNEQIVIPPIEVLNNYNNLQKYFFNTVFTNALESETLATLRDTLLPKLMNNEIKV